MQQIKREWMRVLNVRIGQAAAQKRCWMGEIVTPEGRVEVVLRKSPARETHLRGQRLSDGVMSREAPPSAFYISDDLAAELAAAVEAEVEADADERATQSERERLQAFLAGIQKTSGYRGGNRSANGQYRAKFNCEQPQSCR